MLIVEDNPILDGLLLETLQVEDLYEVFHAPSGGSKQNILQAGAPMFSLLEDHRPGMNGLDNDYSYFNTWERSIKAWYVLISGRLYVQAEHTTVESITPISAPAGDSNDPQQCADRVTSCLMLWHSGKVERP